jgi:hypothetical protein
MKKVGKKELLSLISEQVEIHEKQSKNSQKKRQQKIRKKAVDRRTSVDNDKKLKATIVGVLNKIQKGKEGLQPDDRKNYLINVLKLIKGEETSINETSEDSAKKAEKVVSDQKDELSDDKVKGVVVDELEQVLAPFVTNDEKTDNQDQKSEEEILNTLKAAKTLEDFQSIYLPLVGKGNDFDSKNHRNNIMIYVGKISGLSKEEATDAIKGGIKSFIKLDVRTISGSAIGMGSEHKKEMLLKIVDLSVETLKRKYPDLLNKAKDEPQVEDPSEVLLGAKSVEDFIKNISKIVEQSNDNTAKENLTDLNNLISRSEPPERKLFDILAFLKFKAPKIKEVIRHFKKLQNPEYSPEVDMDEIKNQAVDFTIQYINKGKYDEVIKVLNKQYENFRDKVSPDSSNSQDPEIPEPIIEATEDLDPSLEDDGAGGGDSMDPMKPDPDEPDQTLPKPGEDVDHTYEEFLTQFLNNNIDPTTNDNAMALRADLLKFLLGEFQQDKYKNYRSLDSIMQRGLIAYDKKMAAKKEKIDKKDEDALIAHNQRVKNVRDAFVRSFMKKKPKFEPNEETKELIKQGSDDTDTSKEVEAEDTIGPAADIVKQAFGDLIDANKKNSAFKPLTQMVERIIEIFKDSLEKSKTANDEYLQEPQEGEALQEIMGSKTFRRFFKNKVQDLDSFWSGAHKELVSDIMKPIYDKFIKTMSGEVASDQMSQPEINTMSSIVDSSKVVFGKDDNFNDTVGKISRYFKKLEKTGNFNKAGVLEKLAKGIIVSLASEIVGTYKSRISATGRDEKKTAADNERIEKLANILKVLQDDETLDSDNVDTLPEALEDIKTKSEDSYRPKSWDYDLETADGLVKYLVNTYATNPSVELEGEIAANVKDYFSSAGGSPARQFNQDKYDATERAEVLPVERDAGVQPFYWIEVGDVMNRFFNYIKELELPPETTQEAFGMDKLKSFIEKLKDKSDFYKAMKLLKDPTDFNLYREFSAKGEQKTIMWYLSDKKRFGKFMNRFSGDPLFKKVVNSKLGIFGKLFSRWNSYKFDDKGKLIKQQSNNKTPVSTRSISQNKPSGPTMDLGGLNDPRPSEYDQIQEALKPIIDNMIKEILNK